jgi:hypothetical protein
MFLRPKDLENMRVGSLISLVANTRPCLTPQPHKGSEETQRNNNYLGNVRFRNGTTRLYTTAAAGSHHQHYQHLWKVLASPAPWGGMSLDYFSLRVRQNTDLYNLNAWTVFRLLYQKPIGDSLQSLVTIFSRSFFTVCFTFYTPNLTKAHAFSYSFTRYSV